MCTNKNGEQEQEQQTNTGHLTGVPTCSIMKKETAEDGGNRLFGLSFCCWRTRRWIGTGRVAQPA